MKHVLLSWVLFIAATVSPLHAGYVVSITDGSEASGKIALKPGAVEVQTSSSPTDINFSQILEADFGDAPIQLSYFSSQGAKGTDLPPDWKAQDIGDVDAPGKLTVSDGTYTLSGSGNFPKVGKKGPVLDRLFFAGQQWMGDGQWTVHLASIDAQSPDTSAGLMVRDSLDPGSTATNLDTTTLGAGMYSYRATAGTTSRATPISIAPPVWLRLTRFGLSIYATVSTDEQAWDLVGQSDFKALDNPWVGLYAHTRRDKQPGTASFDNVTFSPAPSSAQVLPPGVILQGGSFIAAACTRLTIDPANPNSPGTFSRGTTPLTIPASQIAIVTSIPLERSQIADLGAHVGLVMKNGDTTDGATDSIANGAVEVNSTLLGITTYPKTDTRACVLHVLQTQPAKYEVRLKDGSMICANDVTVNGASVSIQDVSGTKIPVSLNDIAQFRAGSAQVQSLAELDWKATPPPATATPKTAPAPPAAPAMAPANATPDQTSVVESWRGPSQEQVLQAPVGASVQFPLADKFRAVSMRVMISPNSPPNTQATIRVMADGREVGRSPQFHAGDQPHLVQVTLSSPKSLSLEIESPFDGTKVFIIDPVVIRN